MDEECLMCAKICAAVCPDYISNGILYVVITCKQHVKCSVQNGDMNFNIK